MLFIHGRYIIFFSSDFKGFRAGRDILGDISHGSLSLLVRLRVANLLKSLQTQRPEVEVRIAKAF